MPRPRKGKRRDVSGRQNRERSEFCMVRQSLRTKRLRLRPSSRADALRAFEIRSDWEVARMLSMAAFPPVQEEVADWFGTHGDEWSAGKAYRFAVEHDGNMIGLVD